MKNKYKVCLARKCDGASSAKPDYDLIDAVVKIQAYLKFCRRENQGKSSITWLLAVFHVKRKFQKFKNVVSNLYKVLLKLIARRFHSNLDVFLV